MRGDGLEGIHAMQDTRVHDSFLLFDIDGTMLVTSGVGVRAMHQAGQDLYGERFTIDGIDFAGRLDPLLIDEMLIANSLTPTPQRRVEFRRQYHVRMSGGILEDPKVHALPGVHDMLARLEKKERVALGVLTGNFQETGVLKLIACGIDPGCFQVGVWGDDSPHALPDREHLPPVAFQRYEEKYAQRIEPTRVVVIGDTPHDVRCAKRNGCRSLAVATGKFTQRQLQDAGADRVAADLSAVEELCAWMVGDNAG